MYKIYLKLSKKGSRKKSPRKKAPQTLNLTLSLTYPYPYPWPLTGAFPRRGEGGRFLTPKKETEITSMLSFWDFLVHLFVLCW